MERLLSVLVAGRAVYSFWPTSLAVIRVDHTLICPICPHSGVYVRVRCGVGHGVGIHTCILHTGPGHGARAWTMVRPACARAG